MENDKTSIADLTPAGYNPRKALSMDELASLKKALLEFGDLSGVVFNRRSGNLVSGHQRCKVFSADNEITITERYDPPTRTGTVAEGHVLIDGEKYSYREVDWPDDKEKAANLAANNQGSVNDPALLSSLLKELEELGTVDMKITGFSEDEIDKMIGDLDPDKNVACEVKEWELDDLAMPFWAVVRCPIDRADQVKA
ncbi:MAG TPA: hypothetical protein DHV16_01280, partial [Nitrospiraceae bacterium]|nr:hypothetical protein [Nitrospiraceae bacterium]